jgi:hypothetical protein
MLQLQRYEMFDGLSYVEATPASNGRFIAFEDAVRDLNRKLEAAALQVENVLRGERLHRADRLKLAAQIRNLKEAA